MQTFKKNYLKLSFLFFICLLTRLIPFRAPNIEPVLAMGMPFAKAYGRLVGFSFPFLSMVIYDLLTDRFGIWTSITAVTYGLLGVWAASYFKDRKSSPLNYVKFALMSTLIFDAVTGLSIGPLFFGQSFLTALYGQIPFTALHLIGNISFAMFLSPPIYRFITSEKSLGIESITKIFNPKQA